MSLNFEVVKKYGAGKCPDLLHFPDEQAQLFRLSGGKIMGTPSERVSGGKWENLQFVDTFNISPDNDITDFSLGMLSNFGAIGSYRVEGTDIQKLIIYEFERDMSDYLKQGSINFGIDAPISSFALSLENPIDEESEIDGNVAINEKTSLLSPGAKVIFRFTSGDDLELVELGSFYIDRSNYNLLSDNVSVDGRNLIGKALKDQTLNQFKDTGYKEISAILNEMLHQSNLNINQYDVESNTSKRRFIFEPNKEVLSAAEEILTSLIDWKMEETVEGEIIIGSPSYGLFPQRGIYCFYRDKDIFSRQIERDDQSTFRKVCVHDSKWTVEVYEDVIVYSGWNLQSNKTLFVKVADGTSLSNAQAIALEIASKLENVGKIESFSGPFRPHLLTGDEARIIDDEGSTSLGLITEITHSFGKSGFSTSFTVDSGGRLGKSRLADYINLLNNSDEAGSIGYEDITN